MNEPIVEDNLLDYCCEIFYNVKHSLSIRRNEWEQEYRDPLAAVFRTVAKEIVLNLQSESDQRYNEVLKDVENFLMSQANDL